MTDDTSSQVPSDATAPAEGQAATEPADAADDQSEQTGEAQQATGPGDGVIPPDERLAQGEADDSSLEDAASGDEPHGQAAQEAAGGVIQSDVHASVGAQDDPAAHDPDLDTAGAAEAQPHG